MESSVTVKDVARVADVSVGTVSRVFNNYSNVTEEIRQRVLKAAAELGYTRAVSQDGSYSGSRIKEIGYLYCSSLDTSASYITSNPFWSHILDGVEREACKTNIKVTYRAIGNLVQTPQMLLSTIQEMRLGGILLVGPADYETVQLFKDLKLPLVLVDNYISGLSVDAVICDNFEGGRMATEYLISQGHRRIAFIGGPARLESRPVSKIYTFECRATGYRTALLDAGLPVDYSIFEYDDFSTDGGYEAGRRLIQRGVDFSAIFCANDELAIGASKALREAGYRVPDDVSLIGFDDIDMVEHLTPALTTVRVNKEALGSVAVRSLLMRHADPTMVGIANIIEVELIKRESVSRRNV